VSARQSHGPSAAGAIDSIEDRVARLDWQAIRAELEIHGAAQSGVLLTETECKHQAASYENTELFRSRVVMARHGFGRGEYQYFGYPLPRLVQSLREALYERLAPIANAWHTALSLPARFPARHADYVDLCRQAEQTKPTPLILKYAEGDYNCLHQDLYGELVFPFQAAFLLSRPGEDFTGGEFILTEQRPRMQSRVEAVPLRQGECVIFPVRHRPVRGTRGIYRTAMRHGVSRIRSGQRFTMGVIFHDAA
jgi:uncharacterized protein